MSKSSGDMVPYSVRMRAVDEDGVHISGAEGLYDSLSSANRAVRQYTARAMNHPRGEPSKVMITVQRLKRRPRRANALAVSTIECTVLQEARAEATARLKQQGVTARAIASAMRIIDSSRPMRGAALVDAQSGKRMEPDRARGVRATLMGITSGALRSLRGKLARRGLNRPEVIEALTLATKVASTPGIMAELCASDDPDYTTGYVASSDMGYVRLTNIKPMGSMSGGRVFFIKPGAEVAKIVRELEQVPLLVERTSGV